MYWSGFIDCCGISIVYGFPYSKPTKQNFKTYKNFIDNVKKGEENRALLLIAINSTQKPNIEKFLEKEGFKLLAAGYNSPHGQNNYLYGYVLQEEVESPPEIDDDDLLEELNGEYANSDDRDYSW